MNSGFQQRFGTSTLDEVVDFKKRAANLTDSPSRLKSFVPSHKAPSSQRPRERVCHIDSPPSTSCYLCKEGDHTLSRCPVFKLYDCSQRNRYVKSCNMCTNSLSPSNSLKQCPSRYTETHHTLLHKGKSLSSISPSSDPLV